MSQAQQVYHVMDRARCGSEGGTMWHLEGERLNHVEQVLLKPQECFSQFHVLRTHIVERGSFTSVLVHGHHCAAMVGGAGEQNVQVCLHRSFD